MSYALQTVLQSDYLNKSTISPQTVNGFINALGGVGEYQGFVSKQTPYLDYRLTDSFVCQLDARNTVVPPPGPTPGTCPVPTSILDYAYGQYSGSWSIINVPFEVKSNPLVLVSYLGCSWDGVLFDLKSPYFTTSGIIDSGGGIPGTNLTLSINSAMCLPFPSAINYNQCSYDGPKYILVSVKILKPNNGTNPLPQLRISK
jgi:hypothetical protein